ncbi:MAG: hypothetical protein K0S61_3811 [Anaerocolumna sp.]|nr:hypothetical protein [Anaerocolumna sp.]
MAIRMTGMASGLDTETMIKELVNAQKLKNKKVSDKLTVSEWKEDRWKELNTKLYKLYTDSVSKLRLQGSYSDKKVSTTDDTAATVTAGTNATTGSNTLTVDELASSQYVTSGVLYTADGLTKAKDTTKLSELEGSAGAIAISFNGKVNGLTSDSTIAEVVQAAKDAGLNANFDEKQGRFFIGSKESGKANAFSIDGTNLNILKVDATDGIKPTNPQATGPNGSSIVYASDSEITLNGAKLTGSTNTITANGLTINIKGKTTGTPISVGVSNDIDATYKMVKDFIKSYNVILKEMNTLYYAGSTKDYAPLSDDDKAGMTDDQIEKWETKIKDSVLRRDTTLGSVIDSMKTSMLGSAKVGEKSYTLSTFGIMTSSDYTEKGLLHIYGDTEDSVYADNKDKLKKALTEDPATTIAALSGIFTGLYDSMSTKMKSIPNVRSAYTFFNDKLMDKEQTDYKKRISVLEGKLTDMENKYYKQFSAMETALAKLQSQSSSLAGMLGTSN